MRCCSCFQDWCEAGLRLCPDRFLELHYGGTVDGLQPATPKGVRNCFKNYAPDRLHINVHCL